MKLFLFWRISVLAAHVTVHCLEKCTEKLHVGGVPIFHACITIRRLDLLKKLVL